MTWEDEVFREVSDLATRCFAPRWQCEYGSMSIAGMEDSQENFDQSGFASSVGAKEPEHFSGTDLQRHIPKGRMLFGKQHAFAIGLGQLAYIDGETTTGETPLNRGKIRFG
jgi:hypothetical protein